MNPRRQCPGSSFDHAAAMGIRRSRALFPFRRTPALHDTIAELLTMDEPRKRFAAMLSGLDINYDLGEGHALLGRRMLDLDLVTANGPPAGLHSPARCPAGATQLGEPGGSDITRWADRIQSIDAHTWVRGCFRYSAPSLLPPPCRFRLTDMWPGWES
jgi:hypothetical protein